MARCYDNIYMFNKQDKTGLSQILSVGNGDILRIQVDSDSTSFNINVMANMNGNMPYIKLKIKNETTELEVDSITEKGIYSCDISGYYSVALDLTSISDGNVTVIGKSIISEQGKSAVTGEYVTEGQLNAEVKKTNEHIFNKDIHTTSDEKNIIKNNIIKGVNEVIKATDWEFTITPDMMGKRIITAWDVGRKINLPAPSEVENGSFVEIQFESNNFNFFCEVYTPSGNIRKGKQETNKCIQIGMTTRRYYAKNGILWDTDYVKVAQDIVPSVYINPVEGSDTEPTYINGIRAFASFSQVEFLEELCNLRINTIGDVTLDKSITMKDMNIIWWSNNKTFTIPKDYNIRLIDCRLNMHWFTLFVEGVGFYLAGNVHVELGGYEGLWVKPLSNTNFTLFSLSEGNMRTDYKYGTSCLTLTIDNCHILTNNIEEFSAKGNIISETYYYIRSVVFIKFSDNGTMPDTIPTNVYWCNNSNTLSRIGTSTLYTVG